MSKDSTKKGFSGISTLVSEIDDIEADSIEQNHKTESRADESNDDILRQVSEARLEHKRRSQKTFKLIIGSIVGVGLVTFIFYSELFQGNLSNTNLKVVSSSSSSNNEARPPKPASQQTPDFLKPSVGQGNLLSISEIRWCFRQGIRIDVLREMVNSNTQIAQFNILVNDYNSRCASFRYRNGTLERAQQQVARQRAKITANVSLSLLKEGKTFE